MINHVKPIFVTALHSAELQLWLLPPPFSKLTTWSNYDQSKSNSQPLSFQLVKLRPIKPQSTLISLPFEFSTVMDTTIHQHLSHHPTITPSPSLVVHHQRHRPTNIRRRVAAPGSSASSGLSSQSSQDSHGDHDD